MRAILPALLLLAPALHAAETAPVPRKKLSAISLLPDGSELQGVMLPRYDENRHLTGVLKAKAMTLVNDETIAGETVCIEFFNPDRSPRGRVDLTKALFNQAKGLLEAREPVTIQTDRVNATGTGLVYAFEEGQGFLLGPATTWIPAPIETTMNSRHAPLRTATLVGMSLITQPLPAAPPPPVTATEQAAMQADAAPGATKHAAASQTVRTNLLADLASSEAANASAKAFLEQANLAAGSTTAPPADAASQKPLQLQPGPTDTVITCDGGMYFDADAGVFVYLKNVRVADPRFTLSGANELKIFLGKKPDAAPAKPAKTDPSAKPSLGLGAKFGDVERILATGAVRILQKQVEGGKEPVEASGAIFTYQPKSGEIVLSGGYPWVKQGANFMRAMEPSLNLRIQKNGSFVTEGNWQMGGKIDKQP